MIVFLLAHQDDEFACFSIIEETIRTQKNCLIIYLTKGTTGSHSPTRRNNESLRVLKKLGLKDYQIIFLGEELNIDDGCLPNNLGLAWTALLDRLTVQPTQIYTLAWEAGHQDHDACHVLGLYLAKKFSILKNSFQFPLYRSSGKKIIFYKVLSTLERNGPITRIRLPIPTRLRHIYYCITYTSQAKTWLGLLPFVILHYVLDGHQKTQPLNEKAIDHPTNASEALYEIRNMYSSSQLYENIRLFKESLPEPLHENHEENEV